MSLWSVEIQRRYNGDTMEIQWRFSGDSMEIQWRFMEIEGLVD